MITKIIIIGFIVLVSLLMIAFLSNENARVKANFNKELNELEEQKKLLQYQIKEARTTLNNLTVAKETQLSNVVNDVLNVYDQVSIRIPKDIIEDLTYLDLKDHDEVQDFIENQRQHWKLENSKKLMKRGK